MTDQGHKNRNIDFRFSRALTDNPAVSASVLIQTLEGAQRAIWLIALAKEQKDIKSRARIPDEIQHRYQLKCEPPKSGSYLMSTFLESVQPPLQFKEVIEEVVATFKSVAKALEEKNLDLMASLVPDKSIRRRVVDAFSQIAPKPGSGWHLDLSNNGTTVRMDDSWQRAIRRMYSSGLSEPDRETVNGELIEINFAEHQITILPIGSHKQLKVVYTEDMEDFLLENRRSRIQLTGRVSRDNDEELKSMFALEAIGPLDLSPWELSEIESEGTRLRLKKPIRLTPRIDEDNPRFLIVEEPDLGIDVFAGTVNELLDEVSSDLVILWRQIAQAPDEVLAPKALRLKKHLRAMVEEI